MKEILMNIIGSELLIPALVTVIFAGVGILISKTKTKVDDKLWAKYKGKIKILLTTFLKKKQKKIKEKAGN